MLIQNLSLLSSVDARMSFSPVVKLKMDELFVRWLTDETAQRGLKESLSYLKAGDSPAAKRAIDRIIVVAPFLSLSDDQMPADASRSWYPSDRLCIGVANCGSGASSCASPRPSTPPQFPHHPRDNSGKEHGGAKLFSPRSPHRSASYKTSGLTSLHRGQNILVSSTRFPYCQHFQMVALHLFELNWVPIIKLSNFYGIIHENNRYYFLGVTQTFNVTTVFLMKYAKDIYNSYILSTFIFQI